MYNPHKTINATEKGINICFLDKHNEKRTHIMYDKTLFSKQQIYGNAKYQKIVHNNDFNLYQNKLYQELVYGLSTFDEKSISEMSPEKKYFIKTRQIKAQNAINALKQMIVNSSINSLLLNLFPKSKLVKTLATVNEYNQNYWCKLTFKELNLSKITIAKHLIKHDLLPVNFFQLK